jgi:large subunit ribosomal protein L5
MQGKRMKSTNLVQEKYVSKVIPAMTAKFGYKNIHSVPRLEKIVINTGFGRLVGPKTGDDQKKSIEAIIQDTSVIAGQHATVTHAKKSVAGFKLREHSPIGAKVTLRGTKMNDFFTRFVSVVLPRSRDFQGILDKSVDKSGNCTVGIREHIFFPEISPEKVRNNFGLEVTICTTARSREEGIELLALLGFPFTRPEALESEL